MIKAVDILVIGAGQAGLAMGYFLKQAAASFLILGKENRIGDSWRNRYDSLVLFTPRWFSSLPGLPIKGEPEGYASKDEFAQYLEDYAKAFGLPIQLNTEVKKFSKVGDSFEVVTDKGSISAKHVIVATGPFQNPLIPEFAKQVPSDVLQVHTSEYSNPLQLMPGATLVVGAGNSGAQIAVELSESRKVILSTGHRLKFFPYSLLGKSLFWWFKKIGLYKVSTNSFIGQWLKKQGDPIIGKELMHLLKSKKIELKPRTLSYRIGAIRFEDGSDAMVQNIIWATGYTPEFSWIKIPGAFGNDGLPIQSKGMSAIKGLYFLGLPWQRNRSSALIGGVGTDAKYIAQELLTRQGISINKNQQQACSLSTNRLGLNQIS